MIDFPNYFLKKITSDLFKDTQLTTQIYFRISMIKIDILLESMLFDTLSFIFNHFIFYIYIKYWNFFINF